jgi:pyrroline-5-carboxylate reductase
MARSNAAPTPSASTYAALQSMEADGVGAAFERAMQAACQRADELGNEFGA